MVITLYVVIFGLVITIIIIIVIYLQGGSPRSSVAPNLGSTAIERSRLSGDKITSNAARVKLRRDHLNPLRFPYHLEALGKDRDFVGR